LRINELHEASYRNAVFFITSTDTAGGRKDAKKEFIDSDLQVIEDLGLKQRIFNMNGTIAARRDNAGEIIISYLNVRNELIAALEKGGTGVLIHPWYGRLTNIVCRSFSISEDVSRLGDGKISIMFEVSNTDGIPVENKRVIGRVSTFHESMLDLARDTLAETWEVTVGATNNFEAAKNKLINFSKAVDEATSPIATLTAQNNKHTNLLSNFNADIVGLVSRPSDLADSVNAIMSSVGSLYSTSDGTLMAFENLYDFGDDDVNLPQTTAIAIERKRNNDIMNSVVQSEALSFSYLNASQVEYETVESINEAEANLEVQFDKLALDPIVDPDIVDALTDLRVVTQEFFEEEKLTTSQIITVQTTPTSTRLLAFAYYGESDLGEEIAELNEFFDSALQQGDIRIFTA